MCFKLLITSFCYYLHVPYPKWACSKVALLISFRKLCFVCSSISSKLSLVGTGGFRKQIVIEGKWWGFTCSENVATVVVFDRVHLFKLFWHWDRKKSVNMEITRSRNNPTRFMVSMGMCHLLAAFFQYSSHASYYMHNAIITPQKTHLMLCISIVARRWRTEEVSTIPYFPQVQTYWPLI